MVDPLKQRVPFHVNRMALLALAAAIVVVVIGLRGENTRKETTRLRGNLANRCAAGRDLPPGSPARVDSDRACRKLLSALLDVAKAPQRERIKRVVEGAGAKGVVVGSGKSGNPHGQPGGRRTPGTPGGGGGPGGAGGGGGNSPGPRISIPPICVNPTICTPGIDLTVPIPDLRPGRG